MTRKVCLLVAILAALGSVGIGAPAAFAKSRDVPFQGSYSGTVGFTGPATAAFSGTGVAAYLGRGTNDGVANITGQAENCAGGVVNVNTEVLTAANGDTLTIVSDDVACPISAGVLHGAGEWRVIGGTGRFSGVSGHGTLDGQSDLIHGVFFFQLSGVISAPDGN